MDKDIQKALWDELGMLQTIIDKFDDFSFRIKNWFLTVFAAITGYAVVNTMPTLLWLHFGLIVIFYGYEITYRIRQGDFLKRSREVQKILREAVDIADESKPPNLEKYSYPDSKTISEGSRIYRIQRCVGIDESDARLNFHEWQTILKQFLKSLFQPRVSLPYWATLVINAIALALAYIEYP